MKSSLRPTTINDLPRVRQFLQHSTSLEQPFLNDSLMAWKYWDPREDWDAPRAYVMERDGVILAHAGILPVTFNSGEVRGVQMIDWASAKESPGSGLALVQKLSNMFDFIYSIGGSEMTLKILPVYGFVEYTRRWKGARPLRPFQQILSHQYRNWKLAPRLARNALLALSKPGERGISEGWTCEEIAPSEISQDFSSQSMADSHFSPRGPGYFGYLRRCPVMKVHLYRIQERSRPMGHFAIGVLRGQARLAGVWLNNPNLQNWRAAYSLAQKAATQLPGAFELAVAGSQGTSQQAAAGSGLRIFESTPVFLLNKKGKLSLPADFQFQLTDDDAFFMDSGNASYWT